MTYELWDLADGNRIGEFNAEAKALDLVREILAEGGAESVSSLGLLRIGDNGDPVLVLEGPKFVARASLPR